MMRILLFLATNAAVLVLISVVFQVLGIESILAENGVDATLAKRVQGCLMLSEMGRYAPSELSLQGGNLWSETEAVIDGLDKNLANQ